MSENMSDDWRAFYENREEEKADPNTYGCTCPCCACTADNCAFCEMGYP